ncbi:MAG: hypothetical protein N3H31_05450 [Candidatus Nezhaarchaeota archaeon]|nr:hypothetical protein [Candidatus Nezhaarchaeota archaeon]
MQIPTLVEDPLLARQVIIARQRLKRPLGAEATDCPFCPGREFSTPPAKLVYVVEAGAVKELRDQEGSRVQGWAVRCFDNLYPIITPGQGGAHEVVVETPLHDEQLHRARVEQLALALRATLARAAKMYVEGARYVAIFRNYGREAGASIPHPHTQLVALPFIPSTVLKELETFRRRCPLCHDAGEVFLESGGFKALVPKAPLQSYELMVHPVQHEPTPLSLDSSRVEGLARALREALGALVEVAGDTPHNLWVHAAPPLEGWRDYHWHVEVRPRVNVHAGLELGFEVFVCPKPPGEVAEELRSALRKR